MTIAAVTMVWNEPFFLKKWIDYYKPLLGAENLYILAHGDNPYIAGMVTRESVIQLPRDPLDTQFDHRRWQMLSDIVAGLLGYHDTVICSDVDELLLPTAPGSTLPALIDALEPGQCYCAPGFELFARDDLPEMAANDLALGPTISDVVFAPTYSKAVIAKKRVRFSPGGHGLYDEFPTFTDTMALFHLKYACEAQQAMRLSERTGIAADVRQLEQEDANVALTGFVARWEGEEKRRRQFNRYRRAMSYHDWVEALPLIHEELAKARVARRTGIHEHRGRGVYIFKTGLPDWLQALF